MRTPTRTRCFSGLFVLLLSSSLAHAQETPAEKIRKVLDQNITLNFSGQDLSEVINHLRDVTKLNIVLDQNGPIGILQFAPFGNANVPQPAAVEIKSNGAKLKIALKGLLAAHGLTYVILENSLLITTEDQALTKQMTQRISVKVSDVPLQKALKDLTRSTPLNLVLDPRVAKDAQNAVSLDVDGVTVETAVRLLAELGGLKSVRVDNVLFVTSEARAEKMRQEQPPLKTNQGQQFPNVFGGPQGGMGFGGAGPAIRVPALVPPPPAPPKK